MHNLNLLILYVQESLPPPLKDELVLERLGPMQIRSNYDSLKKEALDLELQIKQQQVSHRLLNYS